jgi:hypothetical protein
MDDSPAKKQRKNKAKNKDCPPGLEMQGRC